MCELRLMATKRQPADLALADEEPMSRLNIENCAVWGSIFALVVAFWAIAAVFGVPFAKHLVQTATERPAACVGLNGSDCVAMMEGR